MAKRLTDDSVAPAQALGKPNLDDFANNAAFGPTVRAIEEPEKPLPEATSTEAEEGSEDDLDLGPIKAVKKDHKVAVQLRLKPDTIAWIRRFAGVQTAKECSRVSQQDIMELAVEEFMAKHKKRAGRKKAASE